MTTKTIKEGQYSPSEITKIGPNRWAVKSRSTPAVYAVARYGHQFKCGCKATSPTCYHVTSVLMRELREKGWVGQVWITETEAKRQRRKTWALTRNGRTFWVTGRPAPEVRRIPGKKGRFVEVQKDLYGRPIADCYWMVQGNLARVSTTIGG